jgi:hypothetical protein
MGLIATNDGYELHEAGKQGYQLKEIGSDRRPIALDNTGTIPGGNFRKLSDSDLKAIEWAKTAIERSSRVKAFNDDNPISPRRSKISAE